MRREREARFFVVVAHQGTHTLGGVSSNSLSPCDSLTVSVHSRSVLFNDKIKTGKKTSL